jgi:hypothetical protein
MDIIIGARRLPKKLSVPQSSKDELNGDNTSGKSRRREQLTDRQEVYDARKRQ